MVVYQKKTQFKSKDITNKKFDRLTALTPTERRDKNNGSVIWKCKCDCGNECYISTHDLTRNRIQSCGCLGSENSKNNIQKAITKHLKEHIIEGTNIPIISRKEVKTNNTSGVTGVTWDKERNKWKAIITFKKKVYYLGRYEKKEDAVKIRKEAEQKLFGEFLEWYNYKKSDFKEIQDKIECLEVIKVYDKVLNSELKRFPRHFWQDITKQELKELLKYFFEVKLKWNDEYFKEKKIDKALKKYKLHTVYRSFKGNSFNIVNFVYPNRFKPWELHCQVSDDYWNIETGIEAMKWLIEYKLKWTDIEIREKYNINILREYKLVNMINSVFECSPFKAINATYPNKFNEEDFKQVPRGYWKKEKAIEEIKEVLDKLSADEIKKHLTVEFFRKNGLQYPFVRFFNSSPFEVVNTIYPNRFKQEEFRTRKKRSK